MLPLIVAELTVWLVVPMARVELLLMFSALAGRVASAAAVSVPEVMVVAPVQVLAPLMVRLPAPSLVKATGCVMFEA